MRAPRFLLLALALTASPAFAQRSVDSHFFRPALFSEGLFAVERPTPSEAGQLGFKFFATHEQAPLRLDFPGAGEEEIISSAQVFHFQAHLGLTRWLELAIDLPIAHAALVSNPGSDKVQGYERLAEGDPLTNVAPAESMLLDIRLGLKFHIFQWRGFQTALTVEGTLPLGDEQVFAGDRFATLRPQLAVGRTLGPVALAANVGYTLRKQTSVMWQDATSTDAPVPLLQSDDEVSFGVGASFRLHRVVSLGAEINGTVPAINNPVVVENRKVFYEDAQCPGSRAPCETVERREVTPPSPSVVEALGGIILTPVTGLNIAVGGGAGLTGGERRVPFRVFAGITWFSGAQPTVTTRDSDGDGIPDSSDECPGAPEDIDGFQDQDGCPDPDNDGDGIPDTKDKCPNEPEDKDGFQDDDGCPDLDNDGDGVPDRQDKCPNEPEDKDGFQDEDGCPDLDNDGDGIADAVDQCPNEPETKNGYQDQDGCPDQVAIAKGQIQVPEKIAFKTGAAELDPQSFKALDVVARRIRENPQVGRIRIEGHTDDTGSAQKNQELSQRRAEAVRAYLVKAGVPADRLIAVGYGATRPIADNKTAENRSKNRRVEFIIIEQNP